MDFQMTEQSDDCSETSLYHATAGLAESGMVGLPCGVSEALADPIVMALMAADRVDRQGFEDLLRRVAAALSRRDPQERSESLTRREKPAIGTGLGKLAKGLALALAVIAGVSGAPRPAAADEVPVAFIRTLGAQAVSVIRSSMPLFEKGAYFDQMMRQDFDLTGICRLCSALIGASPARRSGSSSVTALRIGWFVFTAGSSRNPATEILS